VASVIASPVLRQRQNFPPACFVRLDSVGFSFVPLSHARPNFFVSPSELIDALEVLNYPYPRPFGIVVSDAFGFLYLAGIRLSLFPPAA